MKKTDSLWYQAMPEQFISSDQIHVWRAFLDLNSLEIRSLSGTLSSDEVAKAERFRFEKDKKKFIVARGILRRILGRYVGKDPHELRFEYTANGKPILVNSESGALSFNLSHSATFALYAVTLQKNIGIDIERIRYDIDVAEIARRFFSQEEVNSLESIHENKLHELFFRYWTRKEAFLKATGDGISFPMEKIDVSLINGRILSPVRLPDNKRENTNWYVQDLFPGEGYAAAIAVEEAHCNLSHFDYSI